jgi:hypothetical protein
MDNNNLMNQQNHFESQLKTAANWFLTISALSMVNSLVLMFGGKFSFIVGLGVTTIASVIASELGMIGKIIIFGFNLVAAGVFVTFGILGKKQYKWALIIGMVLYAIDGLFFLLAQDFLSLAFHGYALFRIYNGIPAINSLKRLKIEQSQYQEQISVNNPAGV